MGIEYLEFKINSSACYLFTYDLYIRQSITITPLFYHVPYLNLREWRTHTPPSNVKIYHTKPIRSDSFLGFVHCLWRRDPFSSVFYRGHVLGVPSSYGTHRLVVGPLDTPTPPRPIYLIGTFYLSRSVYPIPTRSRTSSVFPEIGRVFCWVITF